MLSIIICSKFAELSSILTANIHETVGVDYEIIHIDNSQSTHSIFSAYNLGVTKSKFPYLCFVHEDVFFRSSDWGLNIIEHLQTPQVGLIGLAGGCLASRIPASWSTHGLKMNLIQSGKGKSSYIRTPNQPESTREEVVLLDGVFLASTKENFQFLQFDENFSGFHAYDYDICMQAKANNLRNYVVYDILLEHFSAGSHNTDYYKNLLLVYKKWINQLPFSCTHLSEAETKLIEKKKLKKLIRKLGIRNFTYSEIKQELDYFATITDNQKVLTWFGFKLFFARLFNNPSRLFK